MLVLLRYDLMFDQVGLSMVYIERQLLPFRKNSVLSETVGNTNTGLNTVQQIIIGQNGLE
jgi:hypothetical protein